MVNPYSQYGYSHPAQPGQGQQQGAASGVPAGMGPGTQGGGYVARPGAYGAHGQGGGYAAPQAGYYPSGYYPAGYYPGYESYPYSAYQNVQTPFFNFGSDRFLKGMLIGAAAAYLLTNESVQRTAIKSAVKVWSVLQGGVEEIKERFEDAEAEIRAAEAGHED